MSEQDSEPDFQISPRFCRGGTRASGGRGARPRSLAAGGRPASAVHAYGFAGFAVDPGSHPGALTTIKVTYYDVTGPDGGLTPFETFTLRRPRRD